MKLTSETMQHHMRVGSTKRAMPIAVACLLMSFLLSTLALAATPRCFVRLYGQWYEWQGSCSDWSAYFNAGYGGDGGTCTYLMSADMRPGGSTPVLAPGGSAVPDSQ